MPILIDKLIAELLTDASVPQLPDQPIDKEDLLVYIEAELSGHDAGQLHPQVQAVLVNSPAWQQEYETIKGFLLAEQNKPKRGPPRLPRFDFSYLPPLPSNYQPVWHWKQVGHLVVTFSEGVLQLLESLRPPEPEYSFERSIQGAACTYQFVLAEPEADLQVRINIQRQRQSSEHYQIVVETEIPSREDELLAWANTTVHLKQAETVTHTRLTDTFGKAVFDNIAAPLLAQLTVEIIPEQPPDLGRQSG